MAVRSIDRSIQEVMETVFGVRVRRRSMQTVHAELYIRDNHWGKREDNRRNHRKDDACGPFSLHTQVLPSVLPGLPSVGDLTAASRTRGIEEDVSSN